MRKIGIAVALLALCVECVTAKTDKPNIVFIFMDDQAPDTVAAWNTWGHGSDVIKTPNLDRLVNAGASFSHTYNMGAWHGAVCVASRSMLNVGRFVWTVSNGEKTHFKAELEAGRFWSQRMKAAGYETYMTGKWHVPAPVGKVFDHVVHERPGMPRSVPSAYQRPVEGKPDPWKPWDKSLGGFWQGGKHWSEVLADDAEAFIEQAAGKDTPFFMYLAFNAVHDPRQSPKEYVDMYPLEKVPLPRNFQPLNEHHAAMGLGSATGKALRDEALAPFPRTEFAVKTHRGEYFALATHADAQVGRILDALEKAGVMDNTYIIYTADHGLSVGRHGLMGKQNMFEHSLRVPFMIVGPGVPSGKRFDTRIYLQDAMATALELAGADATDVDFKSVMPVIRGERDTQYDAIYGTYTARNQRAVIDGDYKLILYPRSRVMLLFNLAADPLEQNDLAGKPESRAIAKRLFAKLIALQKEMGDTLDLTDVYPALAAAE